MGGLAVQQNCRERFYVNCHVIISVLNLCTCTPIIRQHHWQIRQTDLSCDVPTNNVGLAITVKTLIECLAYAQQRYGDDGVVTFNVTTGLCITPDNSTTPNAVGRLYEKASSPVDVDDPIPEFCHTSWNMTYKTQAVGVVEYGDKTLLIDILDKGADIKVQLGENFFLESSYILQRVTERCAVVPFVIAKSAWDTLFPDSFLKITLVCTNGDIFIARQYIGVGTVINSGFENMDITWYTRKLPEDPIQENPIYSHQANGLISKGSKETLVSAVKRGKRIKLFVDSQLPCITSLQRLEINAQMGDCNIIAQNIFRIGVKMYSNALSIPLYWWNALFSTLGEVKISRWYIGSHVHKSDTGTAYDMAWYVDECWGFAFMYSNDGSVLSGSIEILKANILAGRRVRVLFDSYSIEADNILLSNNTQVVTGQFLNQLDTSSPMVFSAGQWKWVRLSTDGSVMTDIYELGSSAKISNSAMLSSASWFVERRKWREVLVTSPNGTALVGSKSALVQAVRQGSTLRCVVVFSNDDTLVFTADNIEIHTDGNVAAQLFKYIEFGDVNDGMFIPYWRIMLVCTTGKVQESRWTVGEHEKRGEVLHNSVTSWFVDT
ncbi:uncharacterized protein LOC132558014 [Ylistrum balloti]|uniref:uncharacterized protein LOC132558014 n=1 Tax=Ylistrum balloti TaxID=509963 RepID=UPI002905B587|nr:uncharacterized protein LOC132558014 [Ylistrum balloti]